MVPVLQEAIRQISTAAWQERLRAAEVPHAPVWDYETLFAHPQAAARGLSLTVRDVEGRPVDLVGSPFHIAGTALPAATMPPRLGQDTDQVLSELLGLDSPRLSQLRQQGVI